MTTSVTALRTQTRAPARTPLRLPSRPRKAVLVVHILAAAAWIGIDVVVAVLVLAGWLGEDPATRGLAYQALGRFVVGPMLTAGLVCLVSGLVLGLGSPWGLIRYWWVAIKLVLNLVLCTLILLVLRPGMAEVVAQGEALSTGAPATAHVSNLFFPPAVSLTALTVATILSVFKPWGRIRKRQAQRIRKRPARRIRRHPARVAGGQ